MSEIFTEQRRVEFAHTDAAGIAHFSSYCCYMEQVEHEFWRHLGTSVVQEMSDGAHLSWPRVHVECDFKGTAKFEDVLEIEVQVLKLGSKSVTFGFGFKLEGQPIAQGQIVAVCCRVQRGQPLESVEIPSELRTKLLPYLVEPKP